MPHLDEGPARFGIVWEPSQDRSRYIRHQRAQSSIFDEAVSVVKKGYKGFDIHFTCKQANKQASKRLFRYLCVSTN